MQIVLLRYLNISQILFMLNAPHQLLIGWIESFSPSEIHKRVLGLESIREYLGLDLIPQVVGECMKRYSWSATEDKEKLKYKGLESRGHLAAHIRTLEMNILHSAKRELLLSLMTLDNDGDDDSNDEDCSEDSDSCSEVDHATKKPRKQ